MSSVESPRAGGGAGSPSGDDDGPNKRPRRTGGGPRPRGVASLTEEQKFRKRENDREAQRKIRERTKKRIEDLEAQVRELKNSQPHVALQFAEEQRDAALAQVELARSRFRQIEAIARDGVPINPAAGGLNDLAAAAAHNALATPTPSLDAPSQLHRPIPPQHHSHTPPIQAPSQHRIAPHAHSHDSGRQWAPPGETPANHVRHWSGEQQFGQTPHQLQQHAPPNGRMGVGYICDRNTLPVDPNLDSNPGYHNPETLMGESMAPRDHFRILPLGPSPGTDTMPTAHLDNIMLSFMEAQNLKAKKGVPLSALTGPAYPNFTVLVDPNAQNDAHELSKLFTDIILAFPREIPGLPEKVAIVYVMFLIMRWHIDPSLENYDRLPEWATPRPSQLFVRHPFWMNHLPWPRLRDRLATGRPYVSFDDFFIPYTQRLSVNWPYAPHDCLVRRSRSVSVRGTSIGGHTPAGTPSLGPPSPYGTAAPSSARSTPTISGASISSEDWIINPAFEAHIRDLANWSVGPAFAAAFPMLAETVRVKDDGAGGGRGMNPNGHIQGGGTR